MFVKTITVSPRAIAPRLASYIVTISSDGKINIYDALRISQDTSPPPEPPQFEPITSTDTKGLRLTCLDLAEGELVTNDTPRIKRQVEEEESSDEEPGDDDEDDEDSAGSEGISAEHLDEVESEVEEESESEAD